MDQKDWQPEGLTNEIINVRLQSAKHCWKNRQGREKAGKLMKVRDINNVECYHFIG